MLHLSAHFGKLQKFLKDLAGPHILHLDEVTEVLLETLSSLLGHDVLLFTGHEGVDVGEEVARRRILQGRESVNQSLNRYAGTC